MKSLLSVLLAVMLVVSFVLSHEVVHAQGEQRTITIYGSFRFTDPSGVNHPLGGARVGLYDDSAFAHVEDWYLFPLAETTTGGDGYYTLPTIDDYHGQRVFVSVFTEHRDFIVTSDSPRLFTTSVYDPYHFSTDAVHDIPSGTYSICGPNCITTDRHEYVINDVQVDQNTGDFSTPFGVFDMVYEIHGYLYDNFWDNHEDLDNDEVTHDKWNISRNGIYERLRIRHPSTAVGFFQSSWWHIKIGRDNDYENLRDTVQHEYSHAVMFKLFDGDVPRTLPDHALDDALNPGHALVEGWAEFFPSIVQNNAIYHTYHNLEFDVFHGNSSGDVVEGSVAGTLYDISDDRDSYDGGPPLQEDDDGVPRRPDLMWQVMRDHKPQNIQDFQESWKNDGLGYDSAFDAVLRAHGIQPNRTIIQFTFGRTTSGAPLSDIFSPNSFN